MTSEIKDGGPAFPQPDIDGAGIVFEGMSLRDWFAGQALAGIMSNRAQYLAIMADRNEAYPDEAVARECIRLADAMLKARTPPSTDGE